MKLLLTICVAVALNPVALLQSASLPSWKDSEAKNAIIQFVEKVTQKGSPDFVPPAERIATFDNDGTLWSEQPIYFQALFLLDRIKQLAPQNPEWQEKEPFASVIKGDLKAILAGGEEALEALVMATHSGMSTEQFETIVADWITSARHPKTGRLYTEMVFQPMLELLTYLRENDFKTFIVSGGGIEFMRPWAERVYGIPPEQVIGSTGGLKYEIREGKPLLLKTPEIIFIDDKVNKPIGIQRHIGRRPIAAFGNSDGDYDMLLWTTSGSGPRLGCIIHHDDAQREWAYDRTSKVGKLSKGLDDSATKGWVVVSMKNDWADVYPKVK